MLRASIAVPAAAETDRIDQEYARQLIDDPSVACGFTRRGFIDIEAEEQVAAEVR